MKQEQPIQMTQVQTGAAETTGPTTPPTDAHSVPLDPYVLDQMRDCFRTIGVDDVFGFMEANEEMSIKKLLEAIPGYAAGWARDQYFITKTRLARQQIEQAPFKAKKLVQDLYMDFPPAHFAEYEPDRVVQWKLGTCQMKIEYMEESLVAAGQEARVGAIRLAAQGWQVLWEQRMELARNLYWEKRAREKDESVTRKYFDWAKKRTVELGGRTMGTKNNKRKLIDLDLS